MEETPVPGLLPRVASRPAKAEPLHKNPLDGATGHPRLGREAFPRTCRVRRGRSREARPGPATPSFIHALHAAGCLAAGHWPWPDAGLRATVGGSKTRLGARPQTPEDLTVAPGACDDHRGPSGSGTGPTGNGGGEEGGESAGPASAERHARRRRRNRRAGRRAAPAAEPRPARPPRARRLVVGRLEAGEWEEPRGTRAGGAEVSPAP